LDDSERAGQLANQLMNYYQVPYAMMSDSNVRAMQQANMANQYDLAKAQYELNKYNAQNQMSALLMNTLMGVDNNYNGSNQKNSSGSDIGQIVGAIAGSAPSIGTSLGSLGGSKE
jgi:hypothetical protein